MPAPGPSGNFPSGNFPSGPSWNVDPQAVVGGGGQPAQPAQQLAQANDLTSAQILGKYGAGAVWTPNGFVAPTGPISTQEAYIIKSNLGTPSYISAPSIQDIQSGNYIQGFGGITGVRDDSGQTAGQDFFSGSNNTAAKTAQTEQEFGVNGGGPSVYNPIVEAANQYQSGFQSGPIVPSGRPSEYWPAVQGLDPVVSQPRQQTPDEIANNTPTPYGGGSPPIYQPPSEQPPPDYGQPQFDENGNPVDISGPLTPQFDLVPQVSQQEQQYLEPQGSPSEGWPTVGGEPSDFSPVTSLYAPGGKYSAPSDSAYTPSILPQDLSTEAPTPQQFGVPPATEPAVNPNTGQPAPQQETADTIPADKVDPKDVVIDPNTGELTDSKTGKVVEPNVDPQTGKTSYPFELPQAAPGPVKDEPIYPIDKGQTEIVPDGQPNEGWPNVPEIQPASQFPQEQFGPPQNLGPSPPPPDYGQPQFEQPGPPVEVYGPLGPPTLPSSITPLSTQEFPYIQGSPSEQPSTWPTPITPLSTQELQPVPGSPSEQPSTWPTPITPLSTQELQPIPGSPSEQPSSGQFTPPPVQPETPTVAPGQPNEGWPAMPGEQAASTPLPMPRPGAPHPMASPFPNDVTPRGFTGVKANVISNVFQAWKSQGASDIAISAILGNIEQESVFDPSLTHPDNHNLQGDRGWSHGLYQENGEEWEKYLAWIEQNSPGSNWRDPLLQSQFAAWNLKTNYPKTWAKMNAAKTPEEAAEIYRKEYLRPAESAANQPHRNVSAHDFYTALHPAPASPAPAPSGANPDVPRGSANLFSSGRAAREGISQGSLTRIDSAAGPVTVNSAAAPYFQAFLNALTAQGYAIRDISGFNDRNKRGGTSKSEHAFGNAIDINPEQNPFHSSTTNMPANISELAARFGLTWGGDWRPGHQDPMHFEWTGVRVPLPAQAPTPQPEPARPESPPQTVPPSVVPPPPNIYRPGGPRTSENTITPPPDFLTIDPTADHVFNGGQRIRQVLAWAARQTPGAYVFVPGQGYLQLPQAGQSVDLGHGYVLTMPARR